MFYSTYKKAFTQISTAILTFGVPLLALANDPVKESSDGWTNLANPLGTTGVETLPDLIVKILNAVVMVGTPLVALGIIWAGFCFIQAQGNAGKIKECRQTFIWTLVGGFFVLGAFEIGDTVQQTVTDIVSFNDQPKIEEVIIVA